MGSPGTPHVMVLRQSSPTNSRIASPSKMPNSVLTRRSGNPFKTVVRDISGYISCNLAASTWGNLTLWLFLLSQTTAGLNSAAAPRT